VAYVDLHTTLLATASPRPNATYFGVRTPPDSVLTNSGAEFNSLSYHGRLKNVTTGEPVEPPQWLVKIFSMARVGDEWLEEMFGSVGWILRKEVRLGSIRTATASAHLSHAVGAVPRSPADDCFPAYQARRRILLCQCIRAVRAPIIVARGNS
jgi:hypothetical protein